MPTTQPSRKKNRVNVSKIKRLSSDQQAQVNQWITQDWLTYPEISEKIFQLSGVRVSRSALCEYRAKLVKPVLPKEILSGPFVVEISVKINGVEILQKTINVPSNQP